MESKKFYRERKAEKKTIATFFDKERKRKRVRKMKEGGYNKKDL